MTTEHRALRELLGSFSLGHLDAAEAAPVQAHLDGCATCRAELAEIAPLADELGALDPDRISDVVSPPPGLGLRIRAAVAQERVLLDARAARAARQGTARRRTRALLAAAAGVVLLLGGVGLGAALTREPAAPAVPVEQLAVERADGAAPVVQSAGLVAHTWGVEVKLVARGFTEGERFRAVVRSGDGELLPAGEFLGTGDRPLTCNLQAALLRPDTDAFVVLDETGAPVLTAEL